MDVFTTTLSHSLRRFRPSQRTEYVLLAATLLLCALNYARRSDYQEFVMREGLGLGFLLVAMAPVIFFGLFALAAFALFTATYAFRKGGRPLPLIILIVGGIWSETASLPPSPAESTFYQYRSDYEAVVELARQRQLGHEGNCLYAFAVPSKYQVLTRGCVFVEHNRGLAVLFRPPTSQRDIAYAENIDALLELITCDGEHGSLFRQLESNWYICTPAQD